MIAECHDARRHVVRAAIKLRLPTPCFMTALSYLDGSRSAWLPANLIRAQRDYFGARAFRRIDVKGMFQTDWTKS
jgi:6-phosphogluconate dehydrogenase